MKSSHAHSSHKRMHCGAEGWGENKMSVRYFSQPNHARNKQARTQVLVKAFLVRNTTFSV